MKNNSSLEKEIETLRNEITINQRELNSMKEKLIKDITKLDKTDLITKKPKLKLWEKIRKIFNI